MRILVSNVVGRRIKKATERVKYPRKKASAKSYFFDDPEKKEVSQVYYGKTPPTPSEIKKRPGGKEYSTLNRYLISPKPNEVAERVARRYASLDKTALRVRTLERLLAMGGVFGVMSAYGPHPKKQNQIRHGKLVAELQRRGYRRFTTLRGQWEGIAEKAVFVPDMSYNDLFELGRQFNQDSVIFKNLDGIVGMYYLKGGSAEVAIDPDTNEAAYQISLGKDLYSKSRGLSFEFDFLWGQKVPWSGRAPITSKEVKIFFDKGLLEEVA